ncbi:hypothetical protein ACVIJW_002825 [Bradyrhizobium barranii subsp. barranii]
MGWRSALITTPIQPEDGTAPPLAARRTEKVGSRMSLKPMMPSCSCFAMRVNWLRSPDEPRAARPSRSLLRHIGLDDDADDRLLPQLCPTFQSPHQVVQ